MGPTPTNTLFIPNNCSRSFFFVPLRVQQTNKQRTQSEMTMTTAKTKIKTKKIVAREKKATTVKRAFTYSNYN